MENKPLTDKERANLEKTYKQMTGKLPHKKVSDLTNEELTNLHVDLIDTKNYLIDNETLFGENYEYAYSIVNALTKQVVNEKKKRNML